MYGHSIIEDINLSKVDHIKNCAEYVTYHIKNSQHFHMGTYSSIYGLTAGVDLGLKNGDLEVKEKDLSKTMAFVANFYQTEPFKFPYPSCLFTYSESVIHNAILSIDMGESIDLYKIAKHSETNREGWWLTPMVIKVFKKPLAFRNGILPGAEHFLTGERAKEFKESLEGSFVNTMALLSATLMLLNTKNIVAIDNPPPAKLNKKRIKNGKQPMFTYKTLRLQLPAQKRKKGSGPASATDNTTRLHLCRGHFKNYTVENPLFGRLTGRYWWQPHARGDKTKGVVIKDYKVETGLKKRRNGMSPAEHEKFINRQCKGKRRFTSRAKARYVAKRMTKRKKTPFNAYKCEVCGYYHVGHTKTPFRRFMLTPHRRGSQEVRV